MKTKIVTLAVILAMLIGGVFLLAKTKRAEKNEGRVAVAASFYPMAEFARQVGGDRIAVTTLVGPGLEPHDYEPTPKDMARLHRSKVLVYNGAGFETWLDKSKRELENGGVKLIDTSQGLPIKGGNGAPLDPHLWLDPVLAIGQVTAIKNGLIAVDPGGKSVYEANAQAYIGQLQALDQSFRAGLANCRLREVVTSHQALGYVAAEYNLEQISLSGLSPDDEPSPGELARAAEFAKVHHATHIFFETLVSPKLAQTIATEVGAQTITFNPLEGLSTDEMRAGNNYLTVQKENLQALRTALHCN